MTTLDNTIIIRDDITDGGFSAVSGDVEVWVDDTLNREVAIQVEGDIIGFAEFADSGKTFKTVTSVPGKVIDVALWDTVKELAVAAVEEFIARKPEWKKAFKAA